MPALMFGGTAASSAGVIEALIALTYAFLALPALLLASRVAHNEDLRMSRNRAVGEHLDATGSVHLGP